MQNNLFNAHFRAKSNGVWVYGYYYNNCDFGVNQNFIVRHDEFDSDGEHILIDSNDDGISICVGLHDKNGKLIFDGDIVTHKFRRIWKTDLHTSIVRWNKQFCCFELFDGVSSHRMRDDVVYEVIGNFIDNKEMFEKITPQKVYIGEPDDSLPF